MWWSQMKVYPAIDLINGKAVRLERGDYGKMTQYSDNPVDVAKQFAQAGAEYIHIVDLDGAKAKRPLNLSLIKQVSEAVNIPIQVGGGIRSEETAALLLKYVSRVIIGTVAVTDPATLKRLIKKFGPKKIVVSIDYKDGLPAVNGWLEKVSLDTGKLQSQLLQSGVKTVIITDTDKDGLLGGPNLELMREWKKSGFEIICAGGVTSAEDITKLVKAGIDGAIIGKALYEGKISLKQALETAK
jgi:phosphoribosylformimino-5-aminoimidazole carboxamide ribotide isomerase